MRLNSTLPPLSELEEAVWDEHLGNDSARREMFVRLLRAEARLDRLLRRWPCVVFSQRPDFSLQFASPNIQELTGVSVAEWSLQPRRFWELVHEQDAVELRVQFKRAVESRTNVTNTYRLRHALTGRVTHILEQREPVISRNKLLLGYEVVWLDVTRQTIAEKRLSTAAWKETLAILTLGMAHDFRNIMAGIHSLSESYLLQMEDAHPFKEGLSLIQKNSAQANQLVQRMINLHLGQIGERSYHDLNEVVQDIIDLVAKILPRRIHVGSELAGESLPIYADLVELRQAVINLLLNAADAMPKGGQLTLKTSRHHELPPMPNMKGSAPRLPSVCLTIRDTGHAASRNAISRRFSTRSSRPRQKAPAWGFITRASRWKSIRVRFLLNRRRERGQVFTCGCRWQTFRNLRPGPRSRAGKAKPGGHCCCWASRVKCSIRPPNGCGCIITTWFWPPRQKACPNCCNPRITSLPACWCWPNRGTPWPVLSCRKFASRAGA